MVEAAIAAAVIILVMIRGDGCRLRLTLTSPLLQLAWAVTRVIAPLYLIRRMAIA